MHEPSSPTPTKKPEKRMSIKKKKTINRSSEKTKEGWVEVDPNKDYRLDPPVIEPDNKFSKPYVLRSDLFYRVT